MYTDERRSTSPSITRVAEPTLPVAVDVAVQAAVAADVVVQAAVAADVVVPAVRVVPRARAGPELLALQFLQFPVPGKALLLLLLQLRKRVRVVRLQPVVEAVAVAVLRRVAAAVAVEVAVTLLPVSPRSRAWRSSTCYWRPVWI
jgi:hypothetical protein